MIGLGVWLVSVAVAVFAINRFFWALKHIPPKEREFTYDVSPIIPERPAIERKQGKSQSGDPPLPLA